MISKRIAIMPIILSIALISMSPAFAVDTTGTLEVGPLCGVNVVDTLEYGLVTPKELSVNAPLNIIGTGNSASIASVSGTNWLNGTNIIILGDSTHFGFTAEPYADKQAINGTGEDSIQMDQNIEAGDNDTFWQVDVQLLDESFIGTISQVLTFVGGCAP